jgi:hypothetical protein
LNCWDLLFGVGNWRIRFDVDESCSSSWHRGEPLRCSGTSTCSGAANQNSGFVKNHSATVSPLPRSSSNAFLACQADGATISTAISAFEAQNPGIMSTEALLVGKKYGGPYLQDWAHNPPFYSYSLNTKGRLYISVPSGNRAVGYRGPASCEFLKGITVQESSATAACQADGATISVAIAAFEAQNPGVLPTEALLVGKKYGGPYLQNWSHNPPFYSYSLIKGELLISIPSKARSHRFKGPTSCEPLF